MVPETTVVVCPKCGRTDQVVKVSDSDLPAASKWLSPPSKPGGLPNPINPFNAGIVAWEENKVLLALGLVLVSIGWIALFGFVGSFWGHILQPWLWVGSAFLSVIFGGLFLYLGFFAKRVEEHADQVLDAYEKDQQAWLSETNGGQLYWMGENDQLDQFWSAQEYQVLNHTQMKLKSAREEGLKLIIFAALLTGLDSIAFLYVPIRTALIYLGFASLPALFGLYILIRPHLDRKRALMNLAEVRRYQSAMAHWVRLYYCACEGVVFLPGEGI